MPLSRLAKKITKVAASLVVSVAATTAGTAFAQPEALADAGTTGWQQHGEAIRTRIVAASQPAQEDGKRLFAWEAELAPGWKTYWRSPGEAGLPVELFLDGNKLELMYPVPERFDLAGIETFGYGKHVMLPFYLNSTQHTANLSASFMVCKEICIPYNAAYNAAAADEGSLVDVRLDAWMKQIPKTITADCDCAALEITDIKLVGRVGQQRLVVDVASDEQFANVDLMVEGVAGVYFEKPQVHLMADGRSARLIIKAISRQASVDLSGADVRMTLSDGKYKAVDQMVTLPG